MRPTRGYQLDISQAVTDMVPVLIKASEDKPEFFRIYAAQAFLEISSDPEVIEMANNVFEDQPYLLAAVLA